MASSGFLLLLKLPIISIMIILAITLLGEFTSDEITFVCSNFDWRRNESK